MPPVLDAEELQSENKPEAVVALLCKYDYPTKDGESWDCTVTDQMQDQQRPKIDIRVTGHHEENRHTWYHVEMNLAIQGTRSLKWKVARRLVHLRLELHDCVKNNLGQNYSKCFASTPFAHKGGLRGTTARLNAWCASLASCMNQFACSPKLVMLVLNFLEVPEPPSVMGMAKCMGSSAADKIWNAAGTIRDKAKQKYEQTKLQTAQAATTQAISFAGDNPKLSKAASSVAFGAAQDNPSAVGAAGSAGFSLLKQNPKAALSIAKQAVTKC